MSECAEARRGGGQEKVRESGEVRARSFKDLETQEEEEP